MKLLLFLFSVSILPALQAQSLPISIDSRFDDWTADADILTDDPNDGTGIELLQMEIANDEGHLFIQLETDDEINLTEGHQLTLYLDTDLDPSTGVAVNGIGAELSVMPGQREVYYQLPGGSGYLSLNDIGFRHLPSVSSTRFEMAFDLQAVSNAGADLFPSGGVRMVWIDKGGPAGDAMPDNGSVFTYLFDPDPVAPVVPVSFDKASPNAIRMLTWNTENNGLDDIDREAFFKKILRAVQPDIVTFNECWDINAFQVASFMNAAVPLGNFQSWKAVKLDQGNVTASRFPILQSWLIFPNHRLTASLIDIPQSISAKDLLVVNGHLRCCDNDYERQLEADAFVQFILDAKTPGGIIDLPPGTPFVLSGDLNLVGNRQQLTTLLTGEVVNTAQYGPGGPLDWDDSNLEDVIGLHTDDRFAFTWRNNFSSFPPSRIDFQIVSGSVLEVEKTFIVDTETMSEERLNQYNLSANDTPGASDHLPKVSDLLLTNSPVATSQPTSSEQLSVASPNPAGTTTQINFTLKTAGPVHFTLKNANGATLRDWTETRQPGNQSLLIDLSTFPAGYYFFYISTPRNDDSLILVKK